MKNKLVLFILTIITCLAFLSSCYGKSAGVNSIDLDDGESDEISFKDKKIPQWSEELKYKIAKAYNKTFYDSSYDQEDFNVNDIPITYYGSYSGYEAVLYNLGSPVITPIDVGGYLFNFGYSNVIMLYKDGSFIRFDDAYKQGKITLDDIKRLYEIYNYR